MSARSKALAFVVCACLAVVAEVRAQDDFGGDYGGDYGGYGGDYAVPAYDPAPVASAPEDLYAGTPTETPVLAPETVPEVTPTEVTPTEVTPTEVTPTEVTPTEVTPTEVTPTEVTPTAEVPTTVPAEDVFAGAPATPTTETPTTETPATETPATETPTTETPATETPATETPATETPSTETPVLAAAPAAATAAEALSTLSKNPTPSELGEFARSQGWTLDRTTPGGVATWVDEKGEWRMKVKPEAATNATGELSQGARYQVRFPSETGAGFDYYDLSKNEFGKTPELKHPPMDPEIPGTKTAATDALETGVTKTIATEAAAAEAAAVRATFMEKAVSAGGKVVSALASLPATAALFYFDSTQPAGEPYNIPDPAVTSGIIKYGPDGPYNAATNQPIRTQADVDVALGRVPAAAPEPQPVRGINPGRITAQSLREYWNSVGY